MRVVHDHQPSGSNAAGLREERLPPSHARENERVIRWSVATAAFLGLTKLGAVIVTGSLGIVAALMDSFLDVVASTVNLLAVRYAAEPADEEHPYGHGKAEGLAALLQGLVVGATGTFLVVEGISRILSGAPPPQHTSIGLWVMGLAVVMSAWITWRLKSVAKRTGSVVLEADAAHYVTDIWTNGGVLLALVAIRITGEGWIDGAVAVVAGVFVGVTSARVLWRAIQELMDSGLAEPERLRLTALVLDLVPEVRDIHRFRARRSGPRTFVDLHVSFDRDLSFVEAHRLAETVRAVLEEARPGTEAQVHADPFPYRPEDDAFPVAVPSTSEPQAEEEPS